MIYLGYKLIIVSFCAAAQVGAEDTDKPLKKRDGVKQKEISYLIKFDQTWIWAVHKLIKLPSSPL